MTAFKFVFGGALALAGASAFANGAVLDQDWQEYAFLIETPHPYADEVTESYPVTLGGAKRIKFHFSKIDLEEDYDTVEIVDGNGRVVDKVTGNHINYISKEVEGDFAVLNFKSDDSQTRWGFRVTKVLVQY